MDSQALAARSVGLIKADPAECFKVVRKDYQHVQLMPNMEEGTQGIRKALRPKE
jgi:hypothetical protein